MKNIQPRRQNVTAKNSGIDFVLFVQHSVAGKRKLFPEVRQTVIAFAVFPYSDAAEEIRNANEANDSYDAVK